MVAVAGALAEEVVGIEIRTEGGSMAGPGAGAAAEREAAEIGTEIGTGRKIKIGSETGRRTETGTEAKAKIGKKGTGERTKSANVEERGPLGEAGSLQGGVNGQLVTEGGTGTEIRKKSMRRIVAETRTGVMSGKGTRPSLGALVLLAAHQEGSAAEPEAQIGRGTRVAAAEGGVKAGAEVGIGQAEGGMGGVGRRISGGAAAESLYDGVAVAGAPEAEVAAEAGTEARWEGMETRKAVEQTPSANETDVMMSDWMHNGSKWVTMGRLATSNLQ
jgi:hypothetical protein